MNKVILSGNLGRDPEVRFTQSGKQVATFSIAVHRGWKKNADNQQPTADFFNIVTWDKLAEFSGRYLKKGTRIIVEGRLQSRTYEAQDGSKRNVVEIIANDIEFASSKRQDSDDSYDKREDSSYNDDMIDSENSSKRDIEIPF